MVRRKNTLPKGSFLHRRSCIHTDFSHIAHKRRNTRFNGLWRVHTPPQPLNAHTAAHRAKQGAFRMGALLLPSERFCAVRKPCAAGCQNGVLCRFWVLAGRCSRRTQKAFGTAMRLCVSLSRGVAAPLGCVICLQLGDVAVFFTLCAVLSERAKWGWYHYPRSVSHGSETLRGQGVERQTLPLLDLGRRRS